MRWGLGLRALRRTEGVVYAKPPFGGPEQVLAYLGRYTHRVAIANSRLVTMTEDGVAFRWQKSQKKQVGGTLGLRGLQPVERNSIPGKNRRRK
jgi:hypothetical protein